MNKEERKKFRQGSKWKNFRTKMKKKYYGMDVISCTPLERSWTLHHINMSHKTYDDLSDEGMFLPLNKDMHDCIHYLYNFYKKDKEVMQRFTDLLEQMYKVNKGR